MISRVKVQESKRYKLEDAHATPNLFPRGFKRLMLMEFADITSSNIYFFKPVINYQKFGKIFSYHVLMTYIS